MTNPLFQTFSILSTQVRVDYMQAAGLRFTADTYSATLPEDSAGVHDVALTQAVGHALNEHLAFTLLNGRGLFDVRPTSGMVHTTGGGALDREQVQSCQVVNF